VIISDHSATEGVDRDGRAVDPVFELAVPNGNPIRASSAAPGRAQHQVSAARWIASRKLPNRRRIVFSDGRIAASVQLSAVGSEPCSAAAARARGVRSTIGTDSRTVADATQTRECERMAGIGMTDKELQTCNQTAYAAAFGG
jgi:hypothetical protein